MMVVSIVTLLILNPQNTVVAMTRGANDAVRLSMTLVALYALWLGFFQILEKTGIANFLAKILSPIVKFLFPKSKKETRQYITLNMSANLLGLGGAATPMAIKAVGTMDTGSTRASINMIMLLVISSTSLQLMPMTVISLRASHGSASPADFVPASIIATVVSTILGITLVKIYGLFLKKREKKKEELGKSELIIKEKTKKELPLSVFKRQ